MPSISFQDRVPHGFRTAGQEEIFHRPPRDSHQLLSFGIGKMDRSILEKREEFRDRMIERLGAKPCDFIEAMRFVDFHSQDPEPWRVAGVLLPLYFQPGEGLSKEKGRGEYVFFLNKRSSKVQQGGDLCAPGGGIHPYLDWAIHKFLRMGMIPFGKGPGWQAAKRKGKEIFDRILLFWGNALRESWEEMRLNPLNVEFMGPLSTYQLKSRRWVLFPLVGRLKKGWRAKLSWEVEKIVPIPLKSFYEERNYALFSLQLPEKLQGKGIPDPWEFPCLTYGFDGEEEVLWGATYHIIRSFLTITVDDPLPVPKGQRIIRKPLPVKYFSGQEDP